MTDTDVPSRDIPNVLRCIRLGGKGGDDIHGCYNGGWVKGVIRGDKVPALHMLTYYIIVVNTTVAV